MTVERLCGWCGHLPVWDQATGWCRWCSAQQAERAREEARNHAESLAWEAEKKSRAEVPPESLCVRCKKRSIYNPKNGRCYGCDSHDESSMVWNYTSPAFRDMDGHRVVNGSTVLPVYNPFSGDKED